MTATPPIAPTPPRPTARRANQRRQREAFTLLELLVVIGILTLLGALVAVGISSSLGKTVDRATTTRLETLDSMLAAFGNADNAGTGGLGNTAAKRLPTELSAIPNSAATYSTVDNRPEDATAGLPLEASLSSDPLLSGHTVRMARTQAVMRRLLSIPQNQQAFAALPDAAKTSVVNTVVDGNPSLLNHAPGSGAALPLDPSLLLDGHGNLILYVPPTGLTNVRFKDNTYLNPNASANEPWRLVATNKRAFWVSAGADGDFQTGDDNVYSTEVVKQNRP